MNSTPKHRLEHDLLGNREVPETAYYGDHTLRARENFAITGISIGIVTALNPYIGYANATEIAAEAHLSGRGVAERRYRSCRCGRIGARRTAFPKGCRPHAIRHLRGPEGRRGRSRR